MGNAGILPRGGALAEVGTGIVRGPVRACGVNATELLQRLLLNMDTSAPKFSEKSKLIRLNPSSFLEETNLGRPG